MKRSFLAPIWNVSGPLAEVYFPAPFRIERWTKRKLFGILSEIEPEAMLTMECDFADTYRDPDDPKAAYVALADVAYPRMLPADNVTRLTREHECEASLAGVLLTHLDLLRLYSPGEPFIPAWYVYEKESAENVLVCTEGMPNYPGGSRYDLSSIDISSLNEFLRSTSLPLKPEYVDLAFEHFLSIYEQHDLRQRFLSLMIALEVLLSFERGELRYRVSRNLAVLLGTGHDSAVEIFNAARKLYDMRSKLVHSGRSDELCERDVVMLEDYIRRTIIRLLELNTPKDKLMERLNETGFGRFNSDAQ